MLRPGAAAWEALPPVPGKSGRLASTAVGLFDRVFIFGGYTVAEDGTEVSTPEVYAFNPVDKTYQRRADMPIPVDDSVSFAYANRYIYLVSGWHKNGNVADVQVLDTWEDKWFSATPFPGAPVFGHAGGIVGNQFVIADGVKIGAVVDGRRQFVMSDENWLGTIDLDDPARIEWTVIPKHPGPPAYRMAATGSEDIGWVIFTGGSANPYNYNGIGYDGEPSEPSNQSFLYDPGTKTWFDFSGGESATMDHRGLLQLNQNVVTVGGMVSGQLVSNHVVEFFSITGVLYPVDTDEPERQP